MKSGNSNLKSCIGFTLVELLIVVTIIVVLLALLVPAMDQAIMAADRVRCMSNQHAIISALSQYTMEHKQFYPPGQMAGLGEAGSYDMRSPWGGGDAALHAASPAVNPMAMGLLVKAKLLPVQQLGRVVHCPIFNNLTHPTNARGHNMDVHHDWGYGASYWQAVEQGTQPDIAKSRIIAGYDYRAPSWNVVNAKSLKLTHVGSGFVMLADILDWYVTGNHREYGDPKGYNLTFADGSALLYDDSDFEFEEYLLAQTGGAGRVAGRASTAATDELMYKFLGQE